MKNIPRRVFFYVAFLGLLIVLGIVFRSFLIENFAAPLALVFWLVLRLLVAVDQKVYWILLILFTFFEAVRHIPQVSGLYSKYPQAASRSAVENVKNWRTFITLTSTADEINRHNLLRQNLTDLLISIYAADQADGAAAFDVYEAVKRRQIPLPDPVYQFLFLEAPGEDHTPRAAWRRIVQAPLLWIAHLRRQDITAYYRSIDGVLSFMETELEITHDNQRSQEPQH